MVCLFLVTRRFAWLSVAASALLLFSTVLGIAMPAWAQSGNIAVDTATAREYMNAGQWDYASLTWRRVLASDPANVQAHIGLAKSMMKTGLTAEAIDHLQGALRTTHQDPLVEVTLGDAYRQTRQYNAAENTYKKVLSRHPGEAGAFKGLVLLKAKFRGQRRATLDRYLKAQAQGAKNQAYQLVKSEKYPESLPYFNLATEYFSKGNLYNDYAVALFLSGKRSQASRIFNRIKGQTKSWRTYANSGMVALSLGQEKLARSDLQTAISLCSQPSDKAKLYNNLGYFYETTQNNKKAVFTYQYAADLDPQLAKAKMNLAFAHQNEAEYDQAIKVYQTILQRDTTNLYALNQLGFIYEMQDKPRRAIDYYEKAIAIDPRGKEAYYNLGMVYRKMGKSAASDEAFKKLSDIELSDMASPNKTADANKKGALKLLDYADLFFADAAATNKSLAGSAPTKPPSQKSPLQPVSVKNP